jgi:hypothetical protein
MNAEILVLFMAAAAIATGVICGAIGWLSGYERGWDDADGQRPRPVRRDQAQAEDVFMSSELARWVAPDPTRLARPLDGETDTTWMRRLTDDFISRIEKDGNEPREEDHQTNR